MHTSVILDTWLCCMYLWCGWNFVTDGRTDGRTDEQGDSRSRKTDEGQSWENIMSLLPNHLHVVQLLQLRQRAQNWKYEDQLSNLCLCVCVWAFSHLCVCRPSSPPNRDSPTSSGSKVCAKVAAKAPMINASFSHPSEKFSDKISLNTSDKAAILFFLTKSSLRLQQCWKCISNM